MTTDEALKVLDAMCSIATANRNDHSLAMQAIKLLKEKLEEKNESKEA